MTMMLMIMIIEDDDVCDDDMDGDNDGGVRVPISFSNNQPKTINSGVSLKAAEVFVNEDVVRSDERCSKRPLTSVTAIYDSISPVFTS